MMKKLKKVPVQVLALALGFALVAVACPNGQSPSGKVNDERPTPIFDDFTITGLSAIFNGNAKTVSIEPNDGKSQGAITIYYEGIDGTPFAKSKNNGPSAIGKYAVTFDVAATSEWKPAAGLIAGTLEIKTQTPDALDPDLTDFNISGLSQDHDGNIKRVSIAPTDGKSQGPITIYYEGTSGTVYTKSINPPTAIGIYNVTFDIAEAYGWKAATGLSAGTLTIYGTPEDDDYEVDSESLNQLLGSVTAVKITAKDGKSPGGFTVYYTGIEGTTYAKSTALPSMEGTYAVTFDVAALGAWKAATGLSAGKLIIGDPDKETPVPNDYVVSVNLNQTAGSVTPVIVTAKDGKSTGQVTVYYAGEGETSYERSSTPPADPGTYAVTFDVAAASGYNAASSLPAGTLTITGTPVADDFFVDNLNQTTAGVSKVTVNPKTGKSSGTVTIYYSGSITLPQTVGTYTVTFDVAAEGVWSAKSGLAGGTLTIRGIPLAGDYNIGNLFQTAGSVSAVTVTVKPDKSPGAVINIRYANSTTLPQTAGSYPVIFDVAASGLWNAASNLEAGTLIISAETAKNYTTGPDALSWGVQTSASVLTLGLTPGDNTTQINLNWYSSGNTNNKVAKVRFVRGTMTAGYELIEVTGAVTAPGTSTTNAVHKATVTGLRQGSSYQYAVSSDGNNWSAFYDFSVPAANSPFKFAVIADPQIHSSTWDANNRYVPTTTGSKTAKGWLDTMEKIVAKGVSFIASAGDQVDTSGGNETEYTYFFDPPGLRSIPLAPVPGNHDNHMHYNYHYNWPNPQTFTAETTNYVQYRNYFYLYSNILFVVLNTAPGSNSAAVANADQHVARFQSTIQAAKAKYPKATYNWDWLIVQHHKSTASVADHCADYDIESYVKGGFEKLMSDEGVDFVLAGHDHVYARSYPLSGRDGGKVSVPDKTKGTNDNHEFINPGDPIYLTFTTGSGLKYYQVAADKQFTYSNTLYEKTNANYPYLGSIAANDTSTQVGSVAYLTKNYLPVSTAVFVQPYIPSYCIAEVNGKTIKFSTYPIITANGQKAGAEEPFSYDANTPYDWVQVTKN